MKKIKAIVSLILASFLLVACGPTMKSEHMKEIETARMEKYNTCVENREKVATARLAAISQLSPEQTTTVMVTDAMTRQAEAFTGKDSCSQGMSVFEMEAIIAKSRNETISNVGGKVVTATGAGYAAYVAGDTIKGVSKTAGDKTEINGDGNTVGIEKVSSNNDQKISAGDESSVSSTAPSVSGPDKSTSETIHEAPVVPEEPVVVE